MPKKPDDPHADRLAVLRERVKQAPTGPGVYRWLNQDGTVLYVGKAKNLKKRLLQYVHGGKQGDGPWRRAFLTQIADFDVTVTNTELEALVLETNLIKELRPKYNVLMKDDKNYVYIRITIQDPYPRIDVVRQMAEDGSKYFGPRLSAEEARQTLAVLRKVYPFRTCRMEIGVAVSPFDKLRASFERSAGSAEEDLERSSLTAHRYPLQVVCRHKDRKTPCLDFHIQQCSAPCVGRVTSAEYRAQCIDPVITFLRGDEAPVKQRLKERMAQAAVEKKYELAAQLRDHLRVLEERAEDVPLVSDPLGDDVDIIGVALLASRAHVVVLIRRGGKVVGERSYALLGQPESDAAVIAQFLAQYYEDGGDIPPVIVIGQALEEKKLIEQLLAARRGKAVELRVPERGVKSHLLELAEKNARQKGLSAEAAWEADRRNTEEALTELQTALALKAPPVRIEGYDISHLGGTETVGSMVVMRSGKAAPDQCRSFTIRTLRKGDVDDYWALKEVLSRRLRRLSGALQEEEERWKVHGITFGRARKEEQAVIEGVHERHAESITGNGIDYRDYLVARHEGEIIGFGRLFTHATKTVELKSVWVEEGFRGGKLGHTIVRKLLKGVARGKVYTLLHADLEPYYAALGFRYVQRPAPVFAARLEEMARERPDRSQPIAMVWDASQNKADSSFTSRPDLLVIDGGKGQLSAVCQVLSALQVDIPVIGLAKREEEVFLPDRSDPVTFRKDSPAKFLLMRLRDEAHRTANRHRTGRGKKSMTRSILDEIPGIGPETKAELLRVFQTVDAIAAAPDSALAAILHESQLHELRDAFARHGMARG